MDKYNYIIDAILLGPGGILIAFAVLRLIYKKSILFSIGFIVAMFGLVMANILLWSRGAGTTSYIWTIPGAFLALFFSFRFLTINVKRPLNQITQVFNLLKAGDFNSVEKIEVKYKNEFQEISQSANLLIDGFSNMSGFAQEIGRGNLDVKYEVLGEKDALGNSLLEMQKSLRLAKEDENKRKIEDEKIHWTNEGFAKFGEILRNNSEDNNEFYSLIIRNLVHYVGVNQGGLFLINDDDEQDTYLELVSMYAFDRQKHAKKRIEIGENLIGQCAIEGESVYMTDIPQSYIRITSGLGDSNPSSLFIIPLKFNDKVFGVIELASFKEFDLYVRDFIEKLGESIASTISTYKVNMKTVRLLKESKMLSEELAAQEEEIRQNMEELQTTQEESARREDEMKNTLDAIKKTSMVCEMDLQGNVLCINNRYLNYLDENNSNVVDSPWMNFIIENEEITFSEVLSKVNNDEVVERKVKLYNNKQLLECYSLIYNAEGFPHKIMNVGNIEFI